MVPVIFSLIYIREMNLYDGDVNASYCISYGDGGVGIGAGIDNETFAVLARLLYPCHKVTFIVGLAAADRFPFAASKAFKLSVDVF